MIQVLIKDISDVFVYIPSGIIIACILTLLMALTQYVSVKRCDWMNVLLWFAFITYLVILVQVALLSREPGSRTAADLIPFSTWGNSVQSHAYVIENVIMFLPMGILLPSVLRNARRAGSVFLISLGISIGIEWLQYMTERGYLQTDDVIMNALGGLGGFLIWKSAVRYFK